MIKLIKNSTLTRKIIEGKFGSVSQMEDLDFYEVSNKQDILNLKNHKPELYKNIYK